MITAAKPGQALCHECGEIYHRHGWIDTFEVRVKVDGELIYRGTASIALMKLFEHAFGLDLITISGKKASEAKPLIDTIASKWLDTGFREHYREMHEDIDGWGPYDAGLAMLDGMKDACAKNSAAIVEIAENS